jgi:hypothetical protein
VGVVAAGQQSIDLDLRRDGDAFEANAGDQHIGDGDEERLSSVRMWGEPPSTAPAVVWPTSRAGAGDVWARSAGARAKRAMIAHRHRHDAPMGPRR